MSRPKADKTDELEVKEGRTAPYTMIPHWIILHGQLDPQAKAVYSVLLMHVNRNRGDGLAWPTRKTIAQMLNWSREQSPDKYLAQLEAVGAIETELFTRHDGSAGIRYYVHQTPPAGYDGPTSLTEWRDRKRAEEAAAPARRPGRPRKAAARPVSPTPISEAPAAATPVSDSEAPAAATPVTEPASPKPRAAKKATAKRTGGPKAPAAEVKSEEEVLLDQRANKGAKLWWDEHAPALVDRKEMTRLTGTAKQRQGKFLALRGMIRGALAANYDSRQILAALEEMKVWLPQAQQFDRALGRQDGVRTQPYGRRGAQPIFRNDQWAPDQDQDKVPSAPDLDVFGIESSDVD
ncbi:hypothetical protein ACFVHW_04475 [Streptomyces sp. NPDC127110]|uniref:hypothetical protein n=1 Tax=Streptomyces sp. NPDC127110 TaxID=3345362 RepID=UPI00362A9C17